MRNVFDSYKEALAYLEKFGSSKNEMEVVSFTDKDSNTRKYAVVRKPREPCYDRSVRPV